MKLYHAQCQPWVEREDYWYYVVTAVRELGFVIG